MRLIYSDLETLDKDKEDEYTQYFWKLIDSVSASRKTFQDFLNQTGWRKLLNKEQEAILERQFKNNRQVDGLWIIPHKKIFTQSIVNGKISKSIFR